jgi:hypothetical protein
MATEILFGTCKMQKEEQINLCCSISAHSRFEAISAKILTVDSGLI